MSAVDPEGRIRHPLDVFHSTLNPDGTFVDAGFIPAADGLGQVEYIDSTGFGSTDAADIDVADSSGYFTGINVETILAELGALIEGVTAHGNTGATETFSAATGVHTATLNADCTFTFTALASGLASGMVLILTQDGTGSRLVTWPGSVVWPGGVAPTLSTAAASVDVFTFMSVDGGTTWFGFVAGGGGSTVAALDDLTDVTITAPADGDTLRFNALGTAFNDNRRWEPVTFDPGTGPEIVFTATDIVMTWETY